MAKPKIQQKDTIYKGWTKQDLLEALVENYEYISDLEARVDVLNEEVRSRAKAIADIEDRLERASKLGSAVISCIGGFIKSAYTEFRFPNSQELSTGLYQNQKQLFDREGYELTFMRHIESELDQLNVVTSRQRYEGIITAKAAKEIANGELVVVARR